MIKKFKLLKIRNYENKIIITAVARLGGAVWGQEKVDAGIFPYSYVVKLKTYDPDSNSYSHGTGVVINENSIITNAHNVFKKDSIVAISGYGSSNGSKIHSVSVKLKKNENVFYPSEYCENENQFDYAVIKYNNREFFDTILKQSSGKRFKLNNVDFENIDTLYVSGYPYYRWFERFSENKTTGKLQIMNAANGKDILHKDNVLQYQLKTRKGNSGSPLWIKQNGEYVIIGIHKSGFMKNNEGILYNQKTIDQINQWVSTQ